jgi:DNA-binding winged helix-turn-helix (wHTH) protein
MSPTQRGGVVNDRVFAFSSFQLHPANRMLLRDGKAVRLGGRALDLLIVLLEHAGEIVSKEKLFASVWPGIFVEDANLRLQIGALRKVLSGGASGELLIQTVPGRGYSLVGEVIEGHDGISTGATTGVSENLRLRATAMDDALSLGANRMARL